MAELVHEHVRRELVVRRHRRVEVVDPAAAVLAVVDHDLDEVVGRGGRHLAQPRVVEGEDVALGAERVVGGAQRAAPEDAVGGARDAAFVGRDVDRPHVEVLAPLPERRDREQDLRQPVRVAVPLVALGRGVAVADEKQVHLLRRRAALLHRPHAYARGRAGRGRSTGRARIDAHRPELLEGAIRVRASRCATSTGADGSGKRTDSSNARAVVFASAVVSHSPKMLAKPREYSTAPDSGVAHLDAVHAQRPSSTSAGRGPGHGPSRTTRAQREALLGGGAGVDVLHAQGRGAGRGGWSLGRRGHGHGAGEGESRDHPAMVAFSLIRRNLVP